METKEIRVGDKVKVPGRETVYTVETFSANGKRAFIYELVWNKAKNGYDKAFTVADVERLSHDKPPF
jgi:hypothetical protein